MTDTDMVERLARIFRDCRTRSQTNPSGDDFKICAADRNDARAAIHAMTEPTDEMRIAGLKALVEMLEKQVEHHKDRGEDMAFITLLLRNSKESDAVFQAMCRTALGEEKGDG